MTITLSTYKTWLYPFASSFIRNVFKKRVLMGYFRLRIIPCCYGWFELWFLGMLLTLSCLEIICLPKIIPTQSSRRSGAIGFTR